MSKQTWQPGFAVKQELFAVATRANYCLTALSDIKPRKRENARKKSFRARKERKEERRKEEKANARERKEMDEQRK